MFSNKLYIILVALYLIFSITIVSCDRGQRGFEERSIVRRIDENDENDESQIMVEAQQQQGPPNQVFFVLMNVGNDEPTLLSNDPILNFILNQIMGQPHIHAPSLNLNLHHHHHHHLPQQQQVLDDGEEEIEEIN